MAFTNVIGEMNSGGSSSANIVQNAPYLGVAGRKANPSYLMQIEVLLNNSIFRPGDDFVLEVRAENFSAVDVDFDLYVVYRVFDHYLFLPSGSSTVDYYSYSSLPMAAQTYLITEFQWPTGITLAIWPGCLNALDSLAILAVACAQHTTNPISSLVIREFGVTDLV